MPFDPKSLSSFPTSPGVYLMKDKEGRVIYVGKAIHLRNRLRNYFARTADHPPRISLLVSQIEEIDAIVVDSEKEALILENNLIKQHQPKYNALLKDDKTYCSLAINITHLWPMIRLVRYKGKPPPKHLYFGPFVKGFAAKQTLELVRRLFPLRQCSDSELVSRKRPCILYDLKRCIAPCVAKCTKEEYDHILHQAIRFLQGHDTSILVELKKEREEATEKLEFEKAAEIHATIEAIEETLEKQKVQQAGLEDLDAIGLYRFEEGAILCELNFREGKLLSSSDYLFLHNAQEDNELLTSFLLQYYIDREDAPATILLSHPLEEADTVEELLSENKNRKIKISHPQRGDKKALVEMAVANAKARLQREQISKKPAEQLLLDLEETLHLLNYPNRIDCFDNSNISGSEPVSAMVVFVQGEKEKKHYRKFKIEKTTGSDDYAALAEVLTRRYRKAKEEDNLPDLILIDGGKGHLQVALKTLHDNDISTVDVVSISKEGSKHSKGLAAEKIFLSHQNEPLLLKPHSPMLLFLQRIRDEAHRFALSFQKSRRQKKTFSSAFHGLPGIGPVKRERLLRRFGSLKRILSASPEEWGSVQGINKRDIETLQKLKINELKF